MFYALPIFGFKAKINDLLSIAGCLRRGCFKKQFGSFCGLVITGVYGI